MHDTALQLITPYNETPLPPAPLPTARHRISHPAFLPPKQLPTPLLNQVSPSSSPPTPRQPHKHQNSQPLPSPKQLPLQPPTRLHNHIQQHPRLRSSTPRNPPLHPRSHRPLRPLLPRSKRLPPRLHIRHLDAPDLPTTTIATADWDLHHPLRPTCTIRSMGIAGYRWRGAECTFRAYDREGVLERGVCGTGGCGEFGECVAFG